MGLAHAYDMLSQLTRPHMLTWPEKETTWTLSLHVMNISDYEAFECLEKSPLEKSNMAIDLTMNFYVKIFFFEDSTISKTHKQMAPLHILTLQTPTQPQKLSD